MKCVQNGSEIVCVHFCGFFAQTMQNVTFGLLLYIDLNKVSRIYKAIQVVCLQLNGWQKYTLLYYIIYTLQFQNKRVMMYVKIIHVQ